MIIGFAISGAVLLVVAAIIYGFSSLFEGYNKEDDLNIDNEF